MLVGNSIPEYILIRLAIFGLRIIAPLSIIYTAALAIALVTTGGRRSETDLVNRYRLPLPLEAYLFAEAGFYLFVYLPLRAWLQTPATHPTAKSKAERQKAFQRVLGTIPDVNSYLSGWFLGAPIDTIERQAVLDYISWSLFNERANQLNDDELVEVNGYVDELEERFEKKLQTKNGKTRPLRTTFDPVPMQHRPLIWYLVSIRLNGCTGLSAKLTFPDRMLD